jgi:ComF family protein
MGWQYIEAMSDKPPPPACAGRKQPISGWLDRLLAWRQQASKPVLAGLPRPCALCGTWDRAGLCRHCRSRFQARSILRCPRCALVSPGGATCGSCLRAPPPYSACIAAADYGFPWDRLISRFKFNDQPELAILLADVLAHTLSQAEPPPADLVLPVPLSPARLAERGFNQAWELARRVAKRRGLLSDAGLLLRLRDTPHQVGLSRTERERNLRDAMWVNPALVARLAQQRVALVDDVMTTGGTAVAATRALLAGGAASVQIWVLARTPPPSA